MKTIDVPLGQSTTLGMSQTPLNVSNNPESFEEYERLNNLLLKIQGENAELKTRLATI
jgi:hypothetical protein